MTDWIPGSWGTGCAKTVLFCSKTDLDQTLTEHWYSYLKKLHNPFDNLTYILSNARMSVQHRHRWSHPLTWGLAEYLTSIHLLLRCCPKKTLLGQPLKPATVARRMFLKASHYLILSRYWVLNRWRVWIAVGCWCPAVMWSPWTIDSPATPMHCESWV